MSLGAGLVTHAPCGDQTGSPIVRYPLFFGVDETGFFPANYRPNEAQLERNPRMRRMASDGTFRKMVINVNASDDPEDIRQRSISTERLSKHRNYREIEQYEGYRWGELNGVHLRQPELVTNPFQTRKAATVYTLMQAGFTGTQKQKVIIDPFWNILNAERHRRQLEEFHMAFEYFGIPTSGVIMPEDADHRFLIVQKADADSYRVYVQSRRDKMYSDSKVELPPSVLLDCVRFMSSH